MSTEEIRNLCQTLELCSADSRSALATCDKLLALTSGKNDTEIKKFKVATLVDALMLDTALALSQDIKWRFGELYCLYRKEKFDEVISALEGCTDAKSSVEERNLLAQSLYRAGRYADAAKNFLSLVEDMRRDGRSAEEIEELVINYTAALTEGNKAADVRTCVEEHGGLGSSRDLLLNTAIATMHAGEVKEALRLMQTTVPELTKAIDEDGSAEPLSADDAAMCSLSGYGYTLLGDDATAGRYYGSVIRRTTKSAVNMAVCLNNIVALHGLDDTFSSLNMMRQVTAKQVASKLSAQQRLVTKYNTLMLQISMGKTRQAISTGEALMKEYPRADLAILGLATAYQNASQTSKAVAALEAFISSVGPSYRAVLTLAELKLHTTKTFDVVLTVLNKLPPQLRYTNNVVAAVMFMSSEMNVPSGVLYGFLSEASKFWSTQDTSAASSQLTLLAQLQMERRLFREASETLRSLLQNNPDDEATLARYVLALSHVDPDEAIKVSARLSAPTAASNMSREDLEAEDVPRRLYAAPVAASSSSATPAAPTKREAERGASASRKRGRKNRHMPTVVDGTADPERWLPMRDRPSMKGKGKKVLARLAQERREYAAKKHQEFLDRKNGVVRNEDGEVVSAKTD
eukprot:PhM_4_TR1011/c0_g1_i1/m.22871/K03108/SRP72; signal recognition particle subunit SRP72